MELPKLKDKYNDLLKDLNFDKLELALKSPNIFEILKIGKAELKHSNFLAWILNPTASHGLGDIILKRVLREIFSDNKVESLDEFSVHNLDYSAVTIRREWYNIDLLIEFPTNNPKKIDPVVICIENKILSKDHKKQLTKYKEILQEHFVNHKRVFVYLTPFGDESNEEKEVYAFYSYLHLLDVLDRVLELYKDSISSQNQIYIRDYVEVLKKEIMQNDETNNLALKIYQHHQDVLDFIFDNKPDIFGLLSAPLKGRILSNGWKLGSEHKHFIRFYTTEIDNLIPRYNNSNGWPQKEGFLFQFDIYDKKNIKFTTHISPGDVDNDYAATLKSIIEKIPGHKKPIGKKWIVQFRENKAFKFEELLELSEEEINQKINSWWKKVEDIVEKVSKAMVENKDKLLPYVK